MLNKSKYIQLSAVLYLLFLSLYVYAQPLHNEQTLVSSGGSSVAVNGGWAVVGDSINNKVHIYPMDYTNFIWDIANKVELLAPKPGAFGSSVAIDGKYMVVGAPEVETWRMEANTITIQDTYANPNFTTVTLQRTYEQPPLVFALASNQGGQPSAVKIRNRTNNSFEIVHAEPMNLDGKHIAMDIFYLAIERGDHVLPDGTRIYAGETATRMQRRSNAAGDSVGWETLFYPRAFSAQPMVLAQIQTMNNENNNVPSQPSEAWLTTAVRSVGTNGFQMTLDRSEVLTATPVDQNETIAFLVMDQGAGTFLDINSASVRFDSIYSTDTIIGWDNGCRKITFNQTFTANPLVIATKDTQDGADGGWLRRCSLSTTDVGLTVDEDQYQDAERGHTNERAGILAFSAPFVATFKAGEAYLYSWDMLNGWQLKETIEPTIWSDDMKFGSAVGISESSINSGRFNIAVGAPLGLNSTALQNGLVYSYSFDGSLMHFTGVQEGDVDRSRAFGRSLDLAGDRLVIGSPDEESTVGAADLAGAAYTFSFDGSLWSPYPTLTDSHISLGSSGEQLGSDVAINRAGDALMLASTSLNNSRSYTYMLSNGIWSQSFTQNNRNGGGVDIDDGLFVMAQANQSLQYYGAVDGSALYLNFSPLQSGSFNVLSSYKEQSMVNDPVGLQAVAVDVPCGIKPVALEAFVWSVISVPCDTGSATIDQLFGPDLGVYGDANNWVMYKQDLDYSGSSSSFVMMASTETLSAGKGYWIIADANKSLFVDSSVSVLHTAAPVDRLSADLLWSLPMTLFAEVNASKVMLGNPYPREISWGDIFYESSTQSGYLSAANVTEINKTAYIYNALSTSGQPYDAVTIAGTPGLLKTIRPYQGFWIRLESDTLTPTFSYPFKK